VRDITAAAISIVLPLALDPQVQQLTLQIERLAALEDPVFV
jgi:hypothetical protein